MKIGVAYYPEHWPEESWPDDARAMREAGVDLVRIGDFAWSRIEKRRGQYDTDWLARAMEIIGDQGLGVILCTPTAAPPPWLFVRHPSMVPDGTEVAEWSPASRRHVCLNNRPYRRYVRRIVREVAKALGNRPELVAWQIDNELGGHGSAACFCDDCEQAFREWLKRRYGIIDRLNKLWGADFWSQHYNDWHEVATPRRTPAGAHPALALDYSRFTSATVRDFVAEQRELIEQYGSGGKPITTNSAGLHLDHIDQFSFGTAQDVAAINNYPGDGRDVDGTALHLDLGRGVKSKPFWILEQQAGATMLPGRTRRPRAGQLRLWSFQAAARGAELLSYFRWRTCPAAQEMHWDGMIDHDGIPRRRFAEITAAVRELKARAELWEGRLPDAPAALVLDYSSHWALGADSMGSDARLTDAVRAMYGFLRRKGIAADVVSGERDLAGYSVVVAPMPIIGRGRDARRWESFVEAGGRLLVTAPAGYRTEHNAWSPGLPPGPLRELLGAEVPDHDVVCGPTGLAVAVGDTVTPVEGLACRLDPVEAETIGSYTGAAYPTGPAVTRMPRGKGAAWFLATSGPPELCRLVLEHVLADAQLQGIGWASETVEVIPLRGEETGEALTFVLNHSPEPVELTLPAGAGGRDALTGTEHSGTLHLDAYGVVLWHGRVPMGS
jgi:beta-galactosidase